ncbi:hypothetical protein T439DRAFT_321792 [Meredithblackwellia eburnea MCA 4105]
MSSLPAPVSTTCSTGFSTRTETQVVSSTITSFSTFYTTSYYYSYYSTLITSLRPGRRMRRDVGLGDEMMEPAKRANMALSPTPPPSLVKRGVPADVAPDGHSYCHDYASEYLFPDCGVCTPSPGKICTYADAKWVDPCAGYCYSSSAPGRYYSTYDAVYAYSTYSTYYSTSSRYISTAYATSTPVVSAYPVATVTTNIPVATATTCRAVEAAGSNKLSKGATAGIAVGTIIGVGILAALGAIIFLLLKRQKQSAAQDTTPPSESEDMGTSKFGEGIPVHERPEISEPTPTLAPTLASTWSPSITDRNSHSYLSTADSGPLVITGSVMSRD